MRNKPFKYSKQYTLNDVGRMVLCWAVSIAIFGALIYMIPVDYLQHFIATDYSMFDDVVRRWEYGIYPTKVTAVWFYILVTMPFVTLFTLYKLDLNERFHSDVYDIPPEKMVLAVFSLFLITIFITWLAFFIDSSNFSGDASRSGRTALYDNSYAGRIVMCGIFGCINVMLVNCNVLTICRAYFCIYKRN